MKNKWAYTSKIYDNGRVVFGGVIPVDPEAKSIFTNKPGFDLYVDVFDTKEEAIISLKNNRDEAYPGFSEEFPETLEV